MASSYQGGGILGKQQQQQHLRSRRGSDAAFLVNGGKPPLAATSSVFAGNRRNCIAGGFPGPKACPSVIFSSQMLGVTVGGCAAFYSAVLSCAPEQPVTISPVNLPACIRVSPSLLVFDRDTWMIPQFFRVAVLSAVYDDNNKGDRKLQVVEHVSSSSDSRFSGNKIMFLPPNVLVQVSGREGCYMFSSGASIGIALPQQLSTSSASSWQTFHEFMQVELEATGAPNSAFVTRELLNARSSVMSHQSFSSVSAGAAGAATGVEVMHALTQVAMASKRMNSRRNLLGSSPSSMSLAPSVQSSADGYYHSTPRDGVAMVKITSRAQHTVVLYKSGKWGLLGKMDVDYTSEEKDKDMTGVNGSRGSNSVLSKMLVDIECGDAHIAALTEQGYVMTWGEGSHGRLGHGTVFTLRGPQAIKSLFHKRVIRIACGAQHTVAVAEDGDVYSWGYGKTGALGHGLNVKEQTFESVHMPMEILTLKGKGVAKVSCGDAHTAVVLQNGMLLTCGWSEYGRLGRSWPNSSSSSEFASCFEKVNLKKKLCTFVACGAAHTLVLTECKSLYAFGWNVNGQLGLGDRRNRHTPTQIQYFDADELVLTSISAGKLHSMALTQDARVFAWGSDELGQCGIGSFPQIYTVPHLVASIVGVNATQVSAGERHSVVLTTASQKQLDSMQSDHPTRYATLMGNFELFVKSDYERQAKVLAYAKESQLRREYEGRKRKPPIDPSSSLAKTLQLQCRVQSDMTQLDAEMNNVIMVNIGQATVAGKAKSRACRPLTAGVALSSSVYYGGSRGEKEDDERVVEQVSSPEASVAKQKRVRCSSATLWRQTRLLTFQPPRVEAPEAQTSRPKSRDLPTSQRRPMGANIVRSTATPKLSVEARKSLATMLNGDPEPQSAFTNMVVRSRADDASRSRTGNGNQQDASFPAMASSPSKSSTNQSAASHFASFPVSRPKSAPSQARSKR